MTPPSDAEVMVGVERQHTLCDECWFSTFGARVKPERHHRRTVRVCCACSRLTTSGIEVGPHPIVACCDEHYFAARVRMADVSAAPDNDEFYAVGRDGDLFTWVLRLSGTPDAPTNPTVQGGR